MADSSHERNRAYYDRNARRYENASWYTFNPYKTQEVDRELRACLERLAGRPFLSVLEIGPGTGYLLERIRRLDPPPLRWVGVEHSEAMAEILRGRHEGWLHSLEIVSESVGADGLPRSLRERSFDLVMGSSILHHLPDYADVVRALAAAVAPEGCLYFVREPVHRDDCAGASPVADTLEPLFSVATRALLHPLSRRILYPQKVDAEDARDVAIHMFHDGVSFQPFRDLEEKGWERVRFRKYNRRLTWFLSALENRWLAGLRKDVLGNTLFAVVLQKPGDLKESSALR